MSGPERLELLAERLRRFGQACRKNPRISALVGMAHERNCPLHLVGGSVRDVLLGHAEPADLDYTLPRDAVSFSREVADALGGTWVPLDLDRDMARVVFKQADGTMEVHDFAAWQMPTLEGDLLKRDLTINAMALDPRPWMGRSSEQRAREDTGAPGFLPHEGADAPAALAHEEVVLAHGPDLAVVPGPEEGPSQPRGRESQSLAGLVDPARGQDDLVRGVVRALSPEMLEDDPLRLLRVVRFSATLGFEVEPRTLGWLEPRAPLLGRVADERVRDEFFKILGVTRSQPAVDLLRRCGLLSVMLPEVGASGAPHVSFDALESLHRLEDRLVEMRCQSAQAGEPGARSEAGLVGEHVTRLVASGHTTEQVLKLAALLVRACDASTVEPLSRRLRLSRVEETMLERTLRGWDMICENAASATFPPHVARRFFAGLKDAGVGAALLALAVGPTLESASDGTAREKHARWLLDWAASAGAEARIPLLDGREVCAVTGMKPGPRLGALLETLLDAQADGKVRSHDEAVSFVRATR